MALTKLEALNEVENYFESLDFIDENGDTVPGVVMSSELWQFPEYPDKFMELTEDKITPEEFVEWCKARAIEIEKSIIRGKIEKLLCRLRKGAA